MAVINAIPGTQGDSILGAKNRQLGPCNIYYRTERTSNLVGLISNISSALTGDVSSVGGTKTSVVTGTGTSFTTDFTVGSFIKVGTTIAKVLQINSNTELVIDVVLNATDVDYYKYLTTVTGVGTSFTNDFVVGDYISAGANPRIAKIITITSNTSLTIESAAITAESNTFRKTDAIFLGNTDATTLKFSVKKAELKDSQYGDSAADQATTGADCSIEAGLSMASLERIEAVTQGFELEKNNSGVVTGFGFGVSLGETDMEIARQLTLVKIVKGIESSNPLDILHFPLATPKIEAEAKYDAASQRYYKTMFTCYRSENHKSPSGRELFFYSEGMF